MLSCWRVRTLKVKCPTWQHVETFYGRKLRKDNTLTLRVPFQAEEGSQVTLGLQLPNDTTVNVEGTVIGLTAAEGDQKNGIRLFLHGMTPAVREQLEAMVAEGLHGRAASHEAAPAPPAKAPPVSAKAPAPPAKAPPPMPPRQAASPRRPPATPPVSVPADAPVDEVLEPPFEPTIQDVSEYEREVFTYLDSELGRLRECAAHEVLEVPEDADVHQVRRAYFDRSKRFHPDLFARYRSRAVLHMAQELFIHFNKAYDRMRDGLVVAGRAIVAGPALLPHDGWLASLDDMDAADEPARPTPAPSSRPARASTNQSAEIEEDVLALVEAGSFEAARERVAAALHFDPRNRRTRALYHFISGRERLAAGETMSAATQFEAALAHDKDCQQARQALDDLHARGHHTGLYPRSMR